MAKRASPTDVIDLTENGEESVEKEGRNATLRSLRRRLSRIPEAGAAAVLPTLKKVKRERTGGENSRENLSTTGEDTDAEATADDDRKPAAKSKTTDHEMEEEDVEFVKAPRNIPTAATAAVGSSDGDEIEVVGTVNQVLLPHMRQHCTIEPYMPSNEKTAKERFDKNVKVCSLCYCYVCDVEASKRQEWRDHSCASDSGPMGEFWTTKRKKRKEIKTNAVERELATQPPASNHQIVGVGPFPPDTTGASGQNSVPTKCRKCGWFNKFAHRNFKFDRDVARGIHEYERYHAGTPMTVFSLSPLRFIRRDTWIGAMPAAVWLASETFTRPSRIRINHRDSQFSWAPRQSSFVSKLTIRVKWKSTVRSGRKKNGRTAKVKWNKNSSSTDWESCRCSR
jgi:hypothetical protein